MLPELKSCNLELAPEKCYFLHIYYNILFIKEIHSICLDFSVIFGSKCITALIINFTQLANGGNHCAEFKYSRDVPLIGTYPIFPREATSVSIGTLGNVGYVIV
mgnify:FL=1